jgi:hypothetical protein
VAWKEFPDTIIDVDGIRRFNNNDGFGGFAAVPKWTLQSHSVYRTLDRFIYIVETRYAKPMAT